MRLSREPAPGRETLLAALEYQRLGWSVVPTDREGAALFPWEPFRYRIAQPVEIGDWFRRWPEAGVGVIVGFVSGVTVLALDDPDTPAGLAPLGSLGETVTSGAGDSRQLYFRHPGVGLPPRTPLAPGAVLCGDGAFVLAPPSPHPCGEPRRWLLSPAVRVPLPLPAWVLERVQARPSVAVLLREGAGPGARREAAAVLAERLLACGLEREEVVELLACWNAARCRPPLNAETLRRVVRPVWDTPVERPDPED